MLKRFRCILFGLLCLLICKTAMRQKPVIPGTVANTGGKPVENASLTLKETLTNNTGTYRRQLSKTSGNILIFIAVGYTHEEPTQTGTRATAPMYKNTLALDAGVVVGYGKQKRKNIIGAVGSVNNHRLDNMTNPSFSQGSAKSLPREAASSGWAGGSLLQVRAGQNCLHSCGGTPDCNTPAG